MQILKAPDILLKEGLLGYFKLYRLN
jgi:hypothetical protein